MRRWWWKALLGLALLTATFFAYRQLLPIYRVRLRSELIMLGDMDGDNAWTTADRAAWDEVRKDPYRRSALDGLRMDVNGDGALDPEDLAILDQLIQSPDPYAAEARAIQANQPFPRPRELYRYLSEQDYLNRPVFALPYDDAATSPLLCLREEGARGHISPYARKLAVEIRDEAIRFDRAYRRRLPSLTEVERTYAQRKIDTCNRLHTAGRGYELLLKLMGLVEDAETLTTRGQDPFVSHLLFFRDHLRGILASPAYGEFQAGTLPLAVILAEVEKDLKADLGMEVSFAELGPPRGLNDLKNYLSRAEWQYYKSRTSAERFERLIRFAQHDRRYLRAVARTSRKSADLGVENHNLPMILLFREALAICDGDKKAAVGLLDEAIRIPFGWVKSIPREKLPGALALENFLLPGNKEDGADKSRHWNVFGGISLYKSPRESLELALKREMQDLREAANEKTAMTEFLRDMIANANGIYHVVSMKPGLAR